MFNIPRDLTILGEDMGIYGSDLFELCQYTDKHCDGEDMPFVVSHLTSCGPIFKELCEFMGGSLS